jgi:alkylated DNA repair dioxygenase AlkB
MGPGERPRAESGLGPARPETRPSAPGLNLAPRDGELIHLPAFLSPERAESLLEKLKVSLDWREEHIAIAGRTIPAPRLVCWYGEPEAVYRYSGVSHHPLPWTEDLDELRSTLETVCACRFNSVLGNLYRSGEDSMGWHADREKSLGSNPVIASLSLGACRVFKLRHNRSRETLNLELATGSLLLMGGSLQHHWRHCLPKTKEPASLRINLTFRQILHPDS